MAFDVDRAKAEITLEEAASRCGVDLPAHGGPPNVRIDCPFDCRGDHAGKRELSVNIVNHDKIFRCHNYECQFRGNLIHLMHGWLTGQRPAEGRVRGEDFKRVKAVLLGETTVTPVKAAESAANPAAAPTAEVEATAPKRNIPLIASDNARARELVGMEAVFTTDPAKMTPKCSAYWRERRHYLTDELCEAWGVGVRPSRAGTDKRGWSLRNHVVYRFLSEDNNVLCYVGRDPEYDDKLRAFEATAAEQRDSKKRPMKHKFPTGFHRGIELYGQHGDRLKQHPEYREIIAHHGVIVVEGFNDVLALDHLGVPAVAICSNRMTEQQAAKVGRWARQLAGGKVSLMFDSEPTGDEGAKEALWLLAQIAPDLDTRLAWSQRMLDGKFRGTQPELLAEEELQSVILPAIRR
jgi:5S rRNA maturation endonuclease (ribonuclease M5)